MFAFEGGFEDAQAQVKVLAPKLDLSPMDIQKVVCDDQIVEEITGNVAKPVAEEERNKDSPNIVANEGVLVFEVTM